MIHSKEKSAFKKILGAHYTAKVIAVLEEKNIKNALGETHSADQIRNVFNGLEEHQILEEAILETVAIERKRIKEYNRKKKQLLKSAS